MQGRLAGVWGNRWVRDALCIALLAVLPVLYLKEVPGGLPPYGGDIFVHVYPLLSLLAHGLHGGRPALWNFYAAGGYPLAPYSALALYPPVALSLLLFPVTGAIAALYAVYLAVLAIGTYLLAGELGQSRPARLLAALTLGFGGFVAAHSYAGHLFELGAICPLPLAYLFLRRAITRRSPVAALWCGGMLGLMALASGPQFLPFALAPLPLLALWRVGWRIHTAGATPWRLAWPLVALALAGLVGVALSAVFILPFQEILGYTLRSSAVPYDTATAQSLPWGGLTMLVAPGALGNAAADSYWPGSRAGPYFHEIYAYAGLLPLLLAPVALARRRAARPYGALALLALLVMLGRNSPIYWLLYQLPGASLFRAPARAGVVLDFALALLAGFGLDALRSRPVSVAGPRAAPRPGSARVPMPGTARPWRSDGVLLAPGACIGMITVLGLLVTVLVAGGHGVPAAARTLALGGAARLVVAVLACLVACILVDRGGARWSLLIPALALLDLSTANGPLFRSTDPAQYYRPTTALTALGTYAAGYRVLALDGAVPLGTSMVTRDFYDVQDAAPLALQEYWSLSHQSDVRRVHGIVANGRDVIRDVDPFFLRLFGVRTVYSPAVVHAPALRLIGRITSLRWTEPGGAHWNAEPYMGTSVVYRDDAALPRFFVVPRAILVTTSDAALALLRAGTVDPARVAVLSPAPAPLTGLAGALQRVWAQWLAGGDDNGLTARVDGGRGGGYLVVDDGWFPGWTATIDGRQAPVQRADYLLRAVRLPPGHHTVRLVYAPLGYMLGALITLATALALLALAAFAVARRLRRRG